MPTFFDGTAGPDDFANDPANLFYRGLGGDDALHVYFGTGNDDGFDGGLGTDTLFLDVPIRYITGYRMTIDFDLAYFFTLTLTDGTRVQSGAMTSGHQWEFMKAADTIAFSTNSASTNFWLAGASGFLSGGSFDAGAGDDVLFGDTGVNTFAGGSGADYISAGLDNGANDSFDGGADNDTIAYSGATAGVTINLLAGTATGASIGSDAIVNFELAVGSMHADVITGTNGHNTIWGLWGNDSVYGLLGNDLVFGENGNDVLIGAGGADALHGEEGADYVYAGDDADTGTGGLGVDVLLGENGADALAGGTEQDYLFGGNDNDTLSGEDGVDVLHGEGGDDVAFGGNGIDYFYAGAGADAATGGNDVDIFVMDAGNDTATGEGGNDYVYAGADNDTVFGGAGVDVLLGEAGNDIIDGGADVDYAYLGTGDDTFIMDGAVAGVNVDVLYDFTPGAGSNDLLRLLSTSFTTIAQVQAAMIDTGNGYSILTIDPDTQIWIIGVTPGQLAAGDVVFS
jgi:Ca2+-binding RTX toxin-like protein